MRRAASQCWSLQNNDCVAVVGGGPAGSFFAIYLLREARRLNRRIEVDRKSTRLNSSHLVISYAVFCLKKKNEQNANQDLDSTPDYPSSWRFDSVVSRTSTTRTGQK